MKETILYALSILLEIGIIPVALLIFKKKISFTKGVFTGAFLFIASYCIALYSFNITYGVSYIDVTFNGLCDQLIETSKTLYTGSDLASVIEAINSFKNVYFMMIPSVIVITNLVGSYLVIMLAKGILAVFKQDVSGFGRFCDFKMSKGAIFLALIANILSGTATTMRLQYAFLNFSAILFFATVLCGLSYVDFKMRKKVKHSVFRIIIYFFVFSFFSVAIKFLFWALMITGVTDAFLDLRKPRIKIDRQM